MKAPAATLPLLLALMGLLSAATAAVGLYAPDRYDVAGVADMCLMPMDFGHCRAKVKRYYFDTRRMKCATFYWGGCAGNVNNFKSLDECNRICMDVQQGGHDEDEAPRQGRPAIHGGRNVSPHAAAPHASSATYNNTSSSAAYKTFKGATKESYSNYDAIYDKRL